MLNAGQSSALTLVSTDSAYSAYPAWTTAVQNLLQMWATTVTQISPTPAALVTYPAPPLVPPQLNNYPIPVNFVAATASAPAYLSYIGNTALTLASQTVLLGLSGDSDYQAAVKALGQMSAQELSAWSVALNALPSGVTLPAGFVFSPGTGGAGGQLVYSGTSAISAPQQALLLSLSSDANYILAIDNLYTASNNANGAATAMLTVLPTGVSFTGAVPVSYSSANGGQLLYTGASPMPAPLQNLLLSLSPDNTYQPAVNNLIAAVGSIGYNGQASVALASLPPGVSFNNLLPVSWNAVTNGALSYTGSSANLPAELSAYLGLSNNPDFQAAVNVLNQLSQTGDTAVAVLLAPSNGLSLINPLPIRNAGGNLTFTGKMTAAQNSVLQSLSADSNWQMAVANLYAISGGMTTPVYQTPLAELPPNIALPSDLTISIPPPPVTGVSAGNGVSVLQFAGPMTSADSTTLNVLSNGDTPFKTMLAQLYGQPRSFIKAVLVAKLTGYLDYTDAVNQLIESSQSAADKGDYLLGAVLAYLQYTQSVNLIQQTLSDALSLDTATLNLLLTHVLPAFPAPGQPSQIRMLSDFLSVPARGFTAAYYNSAEPAFNWAADGLTPAITRLDSSIDFDWGNQTPDPRITGPGFSVDWVCNNLVPPVAAAYVFSVEIETPRNSDGLVLLDGQKILFWAAYDRNDPPLKLVSTPIFLDSTKTHTLEVKYSTSGMIDPSSGPLKAAPKLTLNWSLPTLTTNPVLPSAGPVFQDLQVLYRIAMLLTTLNSSTAQTAYLQNHGGDFAGVNPNGNGAVNFDLSLLPTISSAYIPAWFAQWRRLNELFNLKASLPSVTVSIFDVFSLANQSADFYTTLAPAIVAATNWNSDQLQYLFAELGFSSTDFVSEKPFVVLQKCLNLSNRLGVSSIKLFEWATIAPNDAQAQDIQNTVKANYSEDFWINIGEQLNNKLRCKRRNALIAYILTMPSIIGAGVTDADGLYEFFLIDVQMSPCMLTSRIVQANAAVQLFIQRCLMNLEPEVTPWSISTVQWSWMQNYRVWEANREVFMYPENYMDPTLRDDMTPFFQDLMSYLLQNPITNDNVTQAYMNYLYALDDVAHLHICGSFWQYDTPTQTAVGATTGADNQNSGVINILHVFGSTAPLPTDGSATPEVTAQYYYRRFISHDAGQTLTTGNWTPWEKINLQINSNHLIPVVWAGRLYLCWPTFTSKPANQQSKSASGASSPTLLNLSIGLNYSEYRQGVWISPQLASGILNPQGFNPYLSTDTIDYSRFFYFTKIVNENLVVYVVDTNSDLKGPNELSNPNFVPDSSGNAPPWSNSLQCISYPGTGYVQIKSTGQTGLGGFPNTSSEFIPASVGQTWFASVTVDQAYFKIQNGNAPGTITAWLVITFFDENTIKIDPPQTFSIQPPIKLDTSNPDLDSNGNVIGYKVEVAQPITTQPCMAPNGTAFINVAPMLVSQGPADLDSYLIFSAASLFQQLSNEVGSFIISAVPAENNAVNSTNSSAIPLYPIKGNFSYMELIAYDYALNFSSIGPLIEFQSGVSYQVIFPQDNNLFNHFPEYLSNYWKYPFFFSDTQSTYFAFASSESSQDTSLYYFKSHWHPFVAPFVQALNWQGVSGLLTLPIQCQTNDGGVLLGLDLFLDNKFNLNINNGILVAQNIPLAFSSKVLQLNNSNFSIYNNYDIFYNYTPTGQFYTQESNGYLIPFPRIGNTQNDAYIGSVNAESIAIDDQTPAIALFPNYGSTKFEHLYNPSRTNIIEPYPFENVDFCQGGAYSIYNWELFFHIPLLIATKLRQNQQFQDAKTWLEYIFNPSSNSNGPIPQRFWNFLPFATDTEPQSLLGLLNQLNNAGSDPNSPYSVNSEIVDWMNDPFEPFAIARLRPLAFMKKTVMAYLDNLIAWGDYLFSQNTRESINEATQLYVLAQQILGPKPQIIPNPNVTQDLTYNDLLGELNNNSFSGAAAQFESSFSLLSMGVPVVNDSGTSGNPTLVQPGYFCIPANAQLLAYWDTVADRLYKIRHCMNIAGQVEQLPLFAPSINPMLLVQAAAEGVDLSSVINDINTPTPNYRFTYMLQKALELCAETKSLGGALLSALEKKDGEHLSLLRATQETQLLQKILTLKENQVSEAQANLNALTDSLNVTNLRSAYYQGLINGDLSGFEIAQIATEGIAQIFREGSQAFSIVGSGLSLIPEETFGASGMSSPVATASIGGREFSTVASMIAQSLNATADWFSFASTLTSQLGQWDRRKQEWQFQLSIANAEITQINDQIVAANYRKTIASNDQENQQTQIDNAQAIQDFLTNKYTNEQLYSWMVSQVSGIYFQCYQMAYGLAKQAELSMRFDLGLTDTNYIKFGYWNSLRQGLMAAEGLYADIKAMEIAYHDQNVREYEISKTVSLVLLDPIALITLKETGMCFINLPEAYFDMDYPGHYMRRIKSLSLTIPCVAGPYTSINCTLTLVGNKIRVSSDASGNYLENIPDSRFVYDYSASQSIATSSAQNDSGLFEVNFRDERYLPFEGRGAISNWLLEMPMDCNAFDFETITDVLFNLKYTARNGGDSLRSAAKQAAWLPKPTPQTAAVTPTSGNFPAQEKLTRMFSLRHEFPTEWYQLLSPQPGDGSQNMMLPLTSERFPYQYRGWKITITAVDICLKFKNINDPKRFPGTGSPQAEFQSAGGNLNVYVTPGPMPLKNVTPQPPASEPRAANTITLNSNSNFMNGAPYGSNSNNSNNSFFGGPGIWWLQFWKSSNPGDLNSLPQSLTDSNNHLLPDLIHDIYLVLHYQAKPPRT